MNDLITLHEGHPFTSSLAIAEGTENEHKAVIQLVRTYLDDFDSFGRVTFEMRPFATAGGTQAREVALLNEQQATLLLTYMRNSEVVRRFKRSLVHAFYEMAQRISSGAVQQFNIPQTLPEALRLAADLADQNKKLEGRVAEQTPKVIALDRIAEADGSFNLRESAKVLQMPERKLHAYLQSNGWIFRHHHGRQWLGYSDKTKAGYLTHKFTEVRGSDGEPKVVEQVRVTPRGITRLSVMLGHQEQLSLAG